MTCGVGRECGEILLRLLAIGLSGGAVIALNAIGVTLVYGVVRTINFAYGDLFALTTVLAISLIQALRLGPDSPLPLLLGGLGLTLAAAMGCGCVGNIVVERVAFRPFRGRSRLAPLIASIGISFMLYQAALLLRFFTNAYVAGEHRSVPGLPEFPRLRIPELLPRFDLADLVIASPRVTYPLKDLLVLLVAAALALLVGWFMQATKVGRALRACAQDAEMAQLCGVDLSQSILLAFILGGALSGAAAFVHAVYFTGPLTQYGAQSGLIAFTAAVFGGLGRPSGAFWSGLLLGVLAAFSDYFLATQWTPVLTLGLLIVLLVIRPLGLIGEERGSDEAVAAGDTILARGSRPGRERGRWAGGALLALGLAYPLLDQALDLRLQFVVIGILVLLLLALGLNLLLGFAGLLDLGYAACFAVGTYTAGMLSPGGPLYRLNPLPDEFLLIVGWSVAATMLFGALNTVLTLRLRGEYLAIVTLAFGQIVPQIMRNLDSVTGGVRGISAIPPPQLLGLSLQSVTARYYLALTLVALTVLASLRLANSRWGRAWAAMSADEPVAASCGISVGRGRLAAFLAGTTVAGVAGALFARSFSYVDPNQSEFWLSAMLLAMVVVGGAGGVRGVILGALLVAGVDRLLLPLLGSWLDAVVGTSGNITFAALGPRNFNYLAFGLVLYLATLARARRQPLW